MRNILPMGVGAGRESGRWLSSTVCTVCAGGRDGGDGVSTLIDGEIIMLLFYCK